jgi:hypothetical protein
VKALRCNLFISNSEDTGLMAKLYKCLKRLYIHPLVWKKYSKLKCFIILPFWKKPSKIIFPTLVQSKLKYKVTSDDNNNNNNNWSPYSMSIKERVTAVCFYDISSVWWQEGQRAQVDAEKMYMVLSLLLMRPAVWTIFHMHISAMKFPEWLYRSKDIPVHISRYTSYYFNALTLGVWKLWQW